MRIRYFIGIAFLLLAASCGDKNASTANTGHSAEVKIDTVNVFIVKADSAQKITALPGNLMSYENALIRAKVQGYISKLNVDIGSKVYKGEILALIDAPEINSRLQELNEKVMAAKARYQTSKDYYQRISIASNSDGVIAASELQRTKDQMTADSSEFNAAVFAARSYRQVGNYLAIVAPYGGTITKRNINVGSFVGNAGDQPLFELENNSKLRLQVSVPELYTNALLNDNAGELTTRSLPDKKFKAKLVRKAGTIDNDTRSEVWEFEVPNADNVLKAGSYADVKLHFLRQQSTLVIPTSSIVTTLERKFVIKLYKKTIQWVDVRNGFNMGDKQEVFGDIKPGDTLVLKGNEEMKPGLTIVGRFSN